MATSPTELGTKNDCAGEAQQQFTRQQISQQSWLEGHELQLRVNCNPATIQHGREHES
jgi:hypothetical protein